MSSHDQFRELLALSAAGLLDAAEERALRHHLRECPECAANAGSLGTLAAGLRALPAPDPPLGLATRTRARLAADADRREGAVLAAAAAVLGWIMMLAAWFGFRALGGGALGSLLGWMVPVWVTVPAAAGLMRTRRRMERRLQ